MKVSPPSPLRWGALATSLGAVTLLLVLPMYAGMVETSTTGGGSEVRWSNATLLEVNGWSALVALAIPVLASVSSVAPWRAGLRRTADVLGAAIAAAFTILGSMTVGLFFIATSICLLLVAVWPARSGSVS